VIVAAEFELEENVAVLRVHKKMKRTEYATFFATEVRDNKNVVFHNADLYPPLYQNVQGVSWVKTDKKPTVKTRLMLHYCAILPKTDPGLFIRATMPMRLSTQ